jgi:hypothetical protein
MDGCRDLLFDGLRVHLGADYEVLPDCIGSGGTSRVYEVFWRSKGMHAAVKVLIEPLETVQWLVKVRDCASRLLRPA